MASLPSGDFGRKLRDARERKGVSLRQIASATKISITALEALERNDISRLPGGIFSRAFVRSYAVEVGLDPETTLQEFIAQFPSDAVTAGHPATDRGVDEDAVESERATANTFLRLVLLSIPIAIVVIYFGTAGRRRSHAEPQPAPPPVEAPVSSPAPVSAAPTATEPPGREAAPPTSAPDAARDRRPSAADAAAPAASLTPASVPASADRLSVALTVSRACWISASVDGQKKIERTLQPGDDQAFDVTRELVLTAGDAAAVTLTLNGAETKPLGKSGEVVTRRFNPTNFKEYLQPR